MSKILVTGASGHLGRKTLQSLLKRLPANQLVGLVRDPAKRKIFQRWESSFVRGNYFDSASLKHAFDHVDKVMLISAHAFTDRKTAHANVINAAVATGVQHVVYMSIIRKVHSGFVMKEVTEEDLFTEQKLRSSGLQYTFAKHPPFLDVIGGYIGMNAIEAGVRIPAGHGKFAAASRADLAEAHAVILSGVGHENKSYTLTGDPAITFVDVANLLSEVSGKEVPYIPVSDQEFIERKIAEGLPPSVAELALGWVQGMNNGEWDQLSNLKTLIGYEPATVIDYLRDEYLAVPSSIQEAAK